MQKLEKKIEKSISCINDKVKQKKGEIILSFRELSIPGEVTGDFIPPIPENFQYYESGIISGEIQKNKNPEMKNINLKSLNLEQTNPNYLIFGDYFIPIARSLEGFISISYMFQFDIKDLEQLKQGKILLDTRELFYKDLTGIPQSYERDMLQKSSLLIGDEEVEEFLKEKKIRNSNEFFDVLKNPELVRERIDKHYYEKRRELGENLIISANKIANAFRNIRFLEKDVLSSCLINERDLDGSLISYWSNEKVREYKELRNRIFKQMNILDEQLEEGEKLYSAISEPLINGTIIGFPKKISFNNYSDWLKYSLISEVNKTLKKINSYLSKQQEKACSH